MKMGELYGTHKENILQIFFCLLWQEKFTLKT
jgi:hypothetical protein